MILQRITHNNIFYLPKIYMKIHKARRLRPEQKQRHIHTAAILHFCVHKEILMYIIYNFFVMIQYYHCCYCSHCPLEFLLLKSMNVIAYRPTFIRTSSKAINKKILRPLVVHGCNKMQIWFA